jgi:hypothetical protein
MIYIVVGLIFGVLDWYFLDLLASLSKNLALSESLLLGPGYVRILITMALVIANYGIWLIPVIPAAIYERKRSQSLLRSALAAVTIWSAALLSYYTYYAIQLMFVGLPNLEFMLLSNHRSTAYWTDWWPPFRKMIVGQLAEWILVAVIGGAIVGLLSAVLFNRVTKKRMETRH